MKPYRQPTVYHVTMKMKNMYAFKCSTSSIFQTTGFEYGTNCELIIYIYLCYPGTTHSVISMILIKNYVDEGQINIKIYV